jgi:hypothetical protein
MIARRRVVSAKTLVEMRSAVNVVDLWGVLAFVRDLVQGACRKLSS